MNVQYIVERFALIANLSMDEAGKWADICAEAGEDVIRQVKPSTDINAAERTLTAVAAALALYRYSMYKNQISDTSGFTVGDISVNSSSQVSIDENKAKAIFLEARTSAADYLIDEEFGFLQVRT